MNFSLKSFGGMGKKQPRIQFAAQLGMKVIDRPPEPPPSSKILVRSPSPASLEELCLKVFFKMGGKKGQEGAIPPRPDLGENKFPPARIEFGSIGTPELLIVFIVGWQPIRPEAILLPAPGLIIRVGKKLFP